ncbi:hypothetical protein ASZ90_014007 [hydrocarbon metagenome]|uniref:Uncharacterized protein n=1 Tax=hydrocarbon metagenome TaxID=938273 RepID=A0A0W8F651_9ZZZZ
MIQFSLDLRYWEESHILLPPNIISCRTIEIIRAERTIGKGDKIMPVDLRQK